MRVEKIGDATLYLGDCQDILPSLGQVDAVVTDPPYGIGSIWKGGSSKGWGNAKQQTAKRNEWDKYAPSEQTFLSLMQKSVYQIFWGGNYYILPPSRGWLVWNKPERNFTLSEAELAWTNLEKPIRVFDYRRSDPDRKHPTQKPVALMEWCIQKLPDTAKTILDPFMGSGTTGVACAKLGRSFIGIERDEEYFDIACRRIEEAYKQPDMFVSAPLPDAEQSTLTF